MVSKENLVWYIADGYWLQNATMSASYQIARIWLAWIVGSSMVIPLQRCNATHRWRACWYLLILVAHLISLKTVAARSALNLFFLNQAMLLSSFAMFRHVSPFQSVWNDGQAPLRCLSGLAMKNHSTNVNAKEWWVLTLILFQVKRTKTNRTM